MHQPSDRWKPSVTVAAIIEDAGRYLLVEEETAEGLRLNNPAGHLEVGETPLQAVRREALEETACVFDADAIVGLYMARFVRRATGEDVTYLRVAYAGRARARDANRALDAGIVRTLWLTREEIRAQQHRHRSALVMRCVDDHANGIRYPLTLLQDDGTLASPLQR